MTVSEPSKSEVLSLRKLAQEMAASRRESLTTAHLLAAIASRQSPAADLLRDRRLNAETLARLARASTDDERDPIGQVMRRASEVARTSAVREPAAIHLLLALLKERNTGAFRALEQSGIDVSRLRVAAVQIAQGLVEPRRNITRETEPRRAKASTRSNAEPIVRKPVRKPPSKGVIVPLFPPPHTDGPSAPPRATLTLEPTPKPKLPSSTKSASTPARSRGNARRRAARLAQQPLQIDADETGGRFDLDPQSFAVLRSLGFNLTLAASRNELDPVVGREVEIEQTLDVLAKRRANNPCLVGASGVGKTSIARGLAMRIVKAREVRTLDDRILVELPIAQLIAGTGVRGALAERIASICKEVRESAGRVVLFVDDVHQLFAGEGMGEAGGEIKLALSKGELPMVATCTVEDYRRFIDSDPALARCFTAIEVEEPTPQEAKDMLIGMSPVLEGHHGLSISADAVDVCVEWSVRFLPGRALPEKSLSVLDLASARSRRRGRDSVTEAGVAEVVAEMADMPVERLLETDRDRMLALEQILALRVVGHERALARIATILRRNAAGLRGRRPIGSFLLLGTTGVGKTETAKAIAEALFDSADAMTRLDFSEFSEPHSVARLIGSPPGYVGHEMGGQLTEAVRRRPYQVLLLDEFEKAHRDVLQSFLQVLDEGRMTDGRGRTVDFTNTVILLTSNLGSAEASRASERRTIGFSAGGDSKERAVEEAVVKAARGHLPPELYNRIDEILFYQSLSRDHVREVARRLLSGLSARLEAARQITLSFDDSGIEALLEQGGFDPAMGARPMKRAIARLVEAPIAELLLRDEVEPGDEVMVRAGKRGEVRLERVGRQTKGRPKNRARSR